MLGDSESPRLDQTTDEVKAKARDMRNRQFSIESERETDGRWIAEIPEVPGAIAYGKTEEQARERAQAIARRAVSM